MEALKETEQAEYKIIQNMKKGIYFLPNFISEDSKNELVFSSQADRKLFPYELLAEMFSFPKSIR